MAGEYLLRRYGNGIHVTYHDLKDPAVRARSSAFLTDLSQQGWALPTVLVDGEMAQQGYLDLSSLVAVVARKLEGPPTKCVKGR
ncbi:MAG: hypothetical protein EPO21_12900 [Chloroflexota bacterium]|nr:MAG: hypothetical protein EPO21_12900 [Chloroflexota bacterium]